MSAHAFEANSNSPFSVRDDSKYGYMTSLLPLSELKAIRGEGKGHPVTCHRKHRGRRDVELYSFSTSALDGGAWSTLYPCERIAVPIVREAGWTPRPVWTNTEKRKSLAATGVRTPDHPARSESLNRLQTAKSAAVNLAFLLHKLLCLLYPIKILCRALCERSVTFTGSTSLLISRLICHVANV